MKEFDKSLIEEIIGYKFKNPELLERAFTHSSYTNEKAKPSYERLEFLGDSAIGFIIARELYERYPDIDEGKLSKAKSIIVSAQCLSAAIDKTGLIEYLRVGNGNIREEAIKSQSVKCDLFESIAAAILRDSGYDLEECRKFALRFLDGEIKDIENRQKFLDHKSLLLENCAKNGKKAEFRFEKKGDKFLVKLFVDGEYASEGQGRSKKEAEKMAAKLFLEKHI